MDLNPFISAFFLIAVTELGDKSFLTILALASRYDRRSVFIGSLSGVLLMTVLGIAFGSWVAEYITPTSLQLAAALIFLLFGLYTLINRIPKEEQDITLKGSNVVLSSFLLLMVMELGDKTQISVFTLAATGNWLAVMLGAGTAFLLLVGGATFLGDSLGKRLSPKMMNTISGFVFLFFGLLYLSFFVLNTL